MQLAKNVNNWIIIKDLYVNDEESWCKYVKLCFFDDSQLESVIQKALASLAANKRR